MNVYRKNNISPKEFKTQIRILKSSSFVFIISLAALFLSCGISSASEISAKAAVLVDSLSGEVFYAKNPDLRLPPASTTKLITAMVALDKLDPEAVVTISRRAANTPSVKPHLTAGQKISVKDLLYLALMRSINGAAVALAETVAGSEKAFVNLMNKKVQSVGAKNTKFINSSGLPGRKQHTTARDLAELMKESLNYPLISEIINTRIKMLDVDDKQVLLKNTNYLLWSDDNQIGGKTGYTRAAKHCVVSASKKGERTLIVALLGEPVRDDLWEDAKTLLDKGYEMIDNADSIIKTNHTELKRYSPNKS
ncbi:MAG: D-alanyl-D-alanine carboxypeptidase [Nitrospirae bacterium]|nr:D-alanyl-D-alanine carboxypeptidase [Nitrospirota bacterium]